MQEIDKVIDNNPSLAAELVELDIRNQISHKELESYNNTGKFINEHELVNQYNFRKKTISEFEIYRKTSPKKFLNEAANLQQNIRRIESNIRNKKYKTDDEKNTWIQNLEKLKIKFELISEILTN